MEKRIDNRGWGQPGRKIAADLGETGVREFMRIYYASVKMIDDEVGRLLDALDSTGRADDTIVIFTADHGDMLGGHGMVTKSTDAFYDEIVRVPLIIRYPRRIKPKKSDVPACSTDLKPTILEFAGQTIPKNIQGVSLAAHLSGKKSPIDSRQFTFSERVLANSDKSRTSQGTPHGFMIRGQGWKYARFRDGDEHLFEIAKDPGETKNLAHDAEHAATKKRLGEELDSWLTRTGFTAL